MWNDIKSKLTKKFIIEFFSKLLLVSVLIYGLGIFYYYTIINSWNNRIFWYAFNFLMAIYVLLIFLLLIILALKWGLKYNELSRFYVIFILGIFVVILIFNLIANLAIEFVNDDIVQDSNPTKIQLFFNSVSMVIAIVIPIYILEKNRKDTNRIIRESKISENVPYLSFKYGNFKYNKNGLSVTANGIVINNISKNPVINLILESNSKEVIFNYEIINYDYNIIGGESFIKIPMKIKNNSIGFEVEIEVYYEDVLGNKYLQKIFVTNQSSNTIKIINIQKPKMLTS